MRRPLGCLVLGLGILLGVLAYSLQRRQDIPVLDRTVEATLLKALAVLAFVLGAVGLYTVVTAAVMDRTASSEDIPLSVRDSVAERRVVRAKREPRPGRAAEPRDSEATLRASGVLVSE